ncbi:hypothetical protein LY78DRAFT_59803 [Colletotrichum sublineola]|nr:hypothetical protein LY78DRAFT_59803 [Colletotrichum sublineola]
MESFHLATELCLHHRLFLAACPLPVSACHCQFNLPTPAASKRKAPTNPSRQTLSAGQTSPFPPPATAQHLPLHFLAHDLPGPGLPRSKSSLGLASPVDPWTRSTSETAALVRLWLLLVYAALRHKDLRTLRLGTPVGAGKRRPLV